jgi:transposase
MRGNAEREPGFISLINVEKLIAAEHPLRRIKVLVDEALRRLEPELAAMYAAGGRPSIPPEQLLKSKVLQALYTVRSDRQLCARLQTDLLFRWFIDLGLDEEVFNASTFSQNQERLLRHEVADRFFAEVVNLAREGGWVSDEHFSVDATLIQAWASMKSFRPKGEKDKVGPGNPWRDFSGKGRTNDTHQSTTDPEAKLMRKGWGQEARLCFAGHATMENRHGLCVLFQVKPSVGAPESRVAVEQVRLLHERGFRPKTVGADRGYHTSGFIDGMRAQGVTPHPALMRNHRCLGVVVNAAHRTSQKLRKRIEEIFGWSKTVGGLRQSRYRGVERTHAAGQYVVATLNLLRLAKLQALAPPI